MQDELGTTERSALLVLMAAGEEMLPNTELRSRYGIDLSGARRRRLEELKLIETTRVGRGNAYSLTDSGWRRCSEEFDAVRPARSGPAGGALYAVLAGLRSYLSRTDLRIADVFAPVEHGSPAPSVEDRIRAAYRSLPKAPGGWVGLAALRPLLSDLPATEVDAALERMNRRPDVNLVPDSNVKALSAEQRAAAVRFGGESKDLLWIEN